LEEAKAQFQKSCDERKAWAKLEEVGSVISETLAVRLFTRRLPAI
jgi:hypothetical protein